MKVFAAALTIAITYAIDQLDAELKDAEMPIEDKAEFGHNDLPTQESGSEVMGVGAFAGDAQFDKLFSKGACPDVKGMDNIEFLKLSGDWFLQRTDEPSVPELLPSCHHANFVVADDGSFVANEEIRIEGKQFVAENVTGQFTDSIVEAEMFGQKLRVQMHLLDTDYDNYLIGYNCYDNIDFALEKELEPVHIITVGIAARDRNVSEADLLKWEEIAVSKVPDLAS